MPNDLLLSIYFQYPVIQPQTLMLYAVNKTRPLCSVSKSEGIKSFHFEPTDINWKRFHPSRNHLCNSKYSRLPALNRTCQYCSGQSGPMIVNLRCCALLERAHCLPSKFRIVNRSLALQLQGVCR